MDYILLFIIFVLIFGLYLVWCSNTTDTSAAATAVVVGGLANSKKSPIKGQIVLSDNAKLIFDGNNLIHALSGKSSITPIEFETNLKTISHILSESLPNKQLHIVIKNPGEDLLAQFNKKYIEQSSVTLKKKDTPYFLQLVEISKLYPLITYHLAYGKEPKSDKEHYLRGRDDVLSIHLSKPNGYVVSMDKFKDFKHFGKVKAFKHLSVINGEIQPQETIKPSIIIQYLKSPNLGNHLNYKFTSKKNLETLGLNSGDVYVDNDINKYSCLYIERD